MTKAGDESGQWNEASWFGSMHLHWTKVPLYHRAVAFSWLKQRVIELFCQGLIEPLKKTLLVLPTLCGKMCMKRRLPCPPVFKIIHYWAFCTKRGQSAGETSCPRAECSGGNLVLGRVGTTCTTTRHAGQFLHFGCTNQIRKCRRVFTCMLPCA